MSLTCGVDVGGTKILGGVVDEDGTVVEELRVVSPATDVAAIEDAITQRRHRAGRRVTGGGRRDRRAPATSTSRGRW